MTDANGNVLINSNPDLEFNFLVQDSIINSMELVDELRIRNSKSTEKNYIKKERQRRLNYIYTLLESSLFYIQNYE